MHQQIALTTASGKETMAGALASTIIDAMPAVTAPAALTGDDTRTPPLLPGAP